MNRLAILTTDLITTNAAARAADTVGQNARFDRAEDRRLDLEARVIGVPAHDRTDAGALVVLALHRLGRILNNALRPDQLEAEAEAARAMLRSALVPLKTKRVARLADYYGENL